MRILVTKTGNSELKELITEPNETRIDQKTKYADNDISENSIHNWNNFIIESEIKGRGLDLNKNVDNNNKTKTKNANTSNKDLPLISIGNTNNLLPNLKGKVNFKLNNNKVNSYSNNKKNSMINNIMETNAEFTTKINLKQKKINLPKVIMEKYNTESKPSKYNNDFHEENLEDILFLYDSNESIPLKEIINIKALNLLRTNTLQECKLLQNTKNKLKFKLGLESIVIGKQGKNLHKKLFTDEEISKDYRIEKLTKELEFTLPRKYIEFITYIYNKKDVSREFISKVSSLDNNRLDHWNRVCLLYNQKNESKNIQINNIEIIDGIIKSKIEKDNSELKNGLKYVRESLKTSKFYVDKNKNFSTRHRRLNEMMEDMKVLWKELGVDKLSQKSRKKVE